MLVGQTVSRPVPGHCPSTSSPSNGRLDKRVIMAQVLRTVVVMQNLRREGKGLGLTVEAITVSIAVPEPFLADKKLAIELRRRFLDGAEDAGRTVLIDLEAIDFITISAAQALLTDWLVAARARRQVVAIVATPKVDVVESIDAALRRSRQSVYWVRSAARPTQPQIIGDLTKTNLEVLEFFRDRVEATASAYADVSELKTNAATQRLVDLTARGLLLREEQPGREGDLFVYPFRSKNGKPSSAPAAPSGRLASAR
jgi:hypothetical protein